MRIEIFNNNFLYYEDGAYPYDVYLYCNIFTKKFDSDIIPNNTYNLVKNTNIMNNFFIRAIETEPINYANISLVSGLEKSFILSISKLAVKLRPQNIIYLGYFSVLEYYYLFKIAYQTDNLFYMRGYFIYWLNYNSVTVQAALFNLKQEFNLS